MTRYWVESDGYESESEETEDAVKAARNYIERNDIPTKAKVVVFSPTDYFDVHTHIVRSPRESS